MFSLRMTGASAVLCVALLSGSATANNCSYATQQCTAAPCPGTTLDMWGQCVLKNPAEQMPVGCPAGCVALVDGNGMEVLCGLEGAPSTDISTENAAKIQLCMAAPSQECITEIITLMGQTGCTNCLPDLLSLGQQNSQCSQLMDQAECEATLTDVECPEVAMNMTDAPMPADAIAPDAAAMNGTDATMPTPTEPVVPGTTEPTSDPLAPQTPPETTDPTASPGGTTTAPTTPDAAEASPSSAYATFAGALCAASAMGAMLVL